MKKLIISLLLLSPLLGYTQNTYKVILTRAAPGQLKSLIEELKTGIKAYNRIGDEDAYLLRHSQGDQWDLMLIAPISNLDKYYLEDRKNFIERSNGSEYFNNVAWQEDGFVIGPDHEDFEKAFSPHNFFHIEMFVSLPGKQNELTTEREMENIYLVETGRRPNFIFERISGFRYDNFTIGAYSSLLEYAEGGNKPQEVQEKAAIKAGYKSADDIGFYLRSLIAEHHDTLANKVEN